MLLPSEQVVDIDKENSCLTLTSGANTCSACRRQHCFHALSCADS